MTDAKFSIFRRLQIRVAKPFSIFMQFALCSNFSWGICPQFVRNNRMEKNICPGGNFSPVTKIKRDIVWNAGWKKTIV